MRQVHLVQDRQNLQTLLDSGVAVGHRLGLHPLPRIDNQQRALTGRQRSRHLVGEVDVARGIDEIQLVGFPVARLVIEGHALGLDGDTALAFDVHRIQHLFGHLAIAQSPTMLDKPVGQGRLAMVDMGDDGEIANVLEIAHAVGLTTRGFAP